MQQKELAESISKVLYPKDDHIAGRMLRLRQYYFLASATMQCMVREHKKLYGDVRTLPEKVVIQINDMHPALAIPELMRILMDEEGLGLGRSLRHRQPVFNYTNHTVMQEALEAWPEQLFKSMLPRVYAIISEINERFSQKLWKAFPDDRDKISHMSIIAYDEIRMANMCIAVCRKRQRRLAASRQNIENPNLPRFLCDVPGEIYGHYQRHYAETLACSGQSGPVRADLRSYRR